MFPKDLLFDMVTGFVLDPMHTFDIGALKSFVKRIFLVSKMTTKCKKKRINVQMLTPKSLKVINQHYLNKMKKCFIKDPSRKARLEFNTLSVIRSYSIHFFIFYFLFLITGRSLKSIITKPEKCTCSFCMLCGHAFDALKRRIFNGIKNHVNILVSEKNYLKHCDTCCVVFI